VERAARSAVLKLEAGARSATISETSYRVERVEQPMKTPGDDAGGHRSHGSDSD
jgi:hypothetical protein